MKRIMKNHVKVKFSTILLCILAILLCGAAPRGWAVVYVYDYGGEHDIKTGQDWLQVGADTTVNLYADISQYVYAYPGSVLNIHSGNVALYIIVWPGAQVTVYGTNFAVKEGGHLNPSATQFTVDGALGGVLTGTYGNDGPIIELRFVSSVPIQLSPPLASDEVEIDIKPGGNPNNINLKSKGVVPVAVLTTEVFDANDIDPTTVKFAGASPPVRWTLCDVDGDGDDDMLFHFKTQDLVDLDENSTEAILTCKVKVEEAKVRTTNEKIIQGTDTVRILSRKKK